MYHRQFIRICYNYTWSLSCVSLEETKRNMNYLAQTSFHMSIFFFFFLLMSQKHLNVTKQDMQEMNLCCVFGCVINWNNNNWN